MVDIYNNKKEIQRVCNTMRDICDVLFKKTGISYFDYARKYKDGKSFVLATDLDYVNYFVNHDCYQNTPPPLITPGQHLWQGYIDLDFLYDVKMEFNYDNGITIIRKNEAYEEVYNFATSSNNRAILNLYLNRLELLEQFIPYFLDKASKLISRALLKPMAIINIDSYEPIAEFDFTNDLLNKFNQNKSCLKINNSLVELTTRESQCVAYLLKGFSSKKIARELDISYRTVEIYCNQLREKTNCATRMELLSKIENKKFFEKIL